MPPRNMFSSGRSHAACSISVQARMVLEQHGSPTSTREETSWATRHPPSDMVPERFGQYSGATRRRRRLAKGRTSHRWHFLQYVVVRMSISWVSTSVFPHCTHFSPPRLYTRSSN